MKINTISSIKQDTKAALDEILVSIADKAPDLVLFSGSCLYDFSYIRNSLIEKFPNTPLHGGSSCLGIMTNHGVHNTDGFGMSIMTISSDNSDFGTAIIEFDNPFSAGENAINLAIERSGRDGELPDAIWILPAPGGEEEVIRGIESVVGGNVPIVGGSSADNEIKGDWFQFTEQAIFTNSVALVAIYSESIISTAFHCGYEVSEFKGTVTKVEKREIKEIDSKNASLVYNEWSNGKISDFLNVGGNILAASGLYPIGRVVGENYGIPYFKLSHPETINKDGGVTLFTDISVGDEVLGMKGTVDGIVERARNVIKTAMSSEDLEEKDVSGILMTFCAGCMLTIGPSIDEANKNIRENFKTDIPFMASFTFGEQGTFPGGENCHGNLMISVLLFSNKI